MTRRCLWTRSNIQSVRIGRALLNEREPRLRLGPHQPLDHARRRAAILRKRHAQQAPRRRAHRCLLELRGHHLAQALEPPDLYLALAGELSFHQRVFVRVVARIKRPGALRQPVERQRLGQGFWLAESRWGDNPYRG